MRQEVTYEAHKHKAAGRHPASLHVSHVEERKSLVSPLVSLLYILELGLQWVLSSSKCIDVGVLGLYASAGLQVLLPSPIREQVQPQKLSFSVSKASLSQLNCYRGSLSQHSPSLPPHAILLVMFGTTGNLSKIVTEASRSPLSQHNLKGSPLLLSYFVCNARDTLQSYQTGLRTAELIGETFSFCF